MDNILDENFLQIKIILYSKNIFKKLTTKIALKVLFFGLVLFLNVRKKDVLLSHLTQQELINFLKHVI